MAEIREPVEADASAISALLGELGYPATVEEIPARLAELRSDPGAIVFVAELEGRVVAIATAHVINAIHLTPPAAMLTALVVAADARGQGVGRAMVAHAEAWAKGRGARKISLTSALHRVDAHQFYHGLGYAHTGVRLGKAL